MWIGRGEGNIDKFCAFSICCGVNSECDETSYNLNSSLILNNHWELSALFIRIGKPVDNPHTA